MSDAACRASQNALKLISFISSPNGDPKPTSQQPSFQQYSPATERRRNYESFKNSIQPASPVYQSPSDLIDQQLQQLTGRNSLFEKQVNRNDDDDDFEMDEQHQRPIEAENEDVSEIAEELLQLLRLQKNKKQKTQKKEKLSSLSRKRKTTDEAIAAAEQEYQRALERLDDALTRKECELMMREAEIMLGEADEVLMQDSRTTTHKKSLPLTEQNNNIPSKFDEQIQRCRDEVASLKKKKEDLILSQQRQEEEKADQHDNQNDHLEELEQRLLKKLILQKLKHQKPSTSPEKSSRVVQKKRSSAPLVSPPPLSLESEQRNRSLQQQQQQQNEFEERENEHYRHQQQYGGDENNYDHHNIDSPSSFPQQIFDISSAMPRISVHSPPRLAAPSKLKSRQYYAPTPRDIERHYKSMNAFVFEDEGEEQNEVEEFLVKQQRSNSSTLKARPVFSAVELMRHYEETGLQRKYGISLAVAPQKQNVEIVRREEQQQQQNESETFSERKSPAPRVFGKYNKIHYEPNSPIQILEPTRAQNLSNMDSKNYSPIRTITVPPQLDKFVKKQQQKEEGKQNSKRRSSRKSYKEEEFEDDEEEEEEEIRAKEKEEHQKKLREEIARRQDEINRTFVPRTTALPLLQGRESQWIAHTCDQFRRGSIVETTCLLSDLISGRSWYCSLFLLRRHAVPHLPELQLPSCIRCTIFVEDVIDATLMQDLFSVTVNLRSNTNQNNDLDENVANVSRVPVAQNKSSMNVSFSASSSSSFFPNTSLNDSRNINNISLLESSPARLARGANYAGVPCSIAKALGEQHLKIECETKAEARTWLELFALCILEQQKTGEEASP